jgi:hypothetical protein
MRNTIGLFVVGRKRLTLNVGASIVRCSTSTCVAGGAANQNKTGAGENAGRERCGTEATRAGPLVGIQNRHLLAVTRDTAADRGVVPRERARSEPAGAI